MSLCIASYAEARYIAVVKRLLVLGLTAALFVVPTVMRARQRVERRDATRLSIRLNWQGEKRCHDDVDVRSATFEGGLLKIDLVREVRGPMKPRRIVITPVTTTSKLSTSRRRKGILPPTSARGGSARGRWRASSAHRPPAT